MLEVDRFQLDGAETQEAGQSATFEESSEESSATPGSAFVLAPDQHATPLPKGFNPAEELTTSKIEQPELFVASPPATPATEWATFPFVEQPAGSAHEQAEFFVEEVGVKPPEPQSEQAPLPVADHASAPVEQPCIVTPAPPPAPPPSEGTIAPPEAKSSSAPAGAAKKAELQKWDSKVRSLSGSGSKQPASAPFSPEHHPRIERDLPASVIAPRHRGGSNAGVYVAAAALVVFVVGALVVWRFALSGVVPQRGNEAGTPAPQPAAASTEAGRPAAPAPPTSGAPEGMVFVEGGLYDIGRDDADLYARPRRTVALAGFYIDRTEVTRAQYKKFVDATGRSAPEGWTDGNYPPGTDNYPVANVSWQDAADYARWAGRRLPTEAEWEAAARGKDGRIYPWGNRWRTEVANIGTNGVVEVGKFKEGASPAGALDMIGNVWEWTADEFHLYPGNTAAMPASNKLGLTYRVFRGGAYDGSEIHDASYRGFLDGSKGYPKIGFRCVKNADQ